LTSPVTKQEVRVFQIWKKVLSPTANKLYQSLLKFKKVARINKIRATSYRKQLRLAKQFDIKLKSSVFELKKRNIQPKECRYTTDEKVLALALFKQSGRAYSKLRKMFALPTRQTMMAMLNKVPINAGFNQVIFDNLKDAALKLNSRVEYFVGPE
jgi:hypothetical protein